MKTVNQYKGLQKEVYVICACTVIDELGSLIGPMFTLILSVIIGLNATQIAAWALIFSIFSMPAGLLGGKMADKYNKKLLINICDITSSIIFIVCGLFTLSKTSIIFYLFGTLLQKIESPSYNVLIGDITTVKDRDKAYSLKYLCKNLGCMMAPVIGGFLLKNNANLIFIISGIMQLLSIIVFDICIKETRTTADKDNKYEAIKDDTNFFNVLKNNKIVFYFILITAFTILCYGQFTYILPLEFSKAYGDTGSIIYGTVSSVNCITVLVITSFVTNFISRFTTLDKMALGEVFELFGFIGFVLFIKSPLICYIACFVFTIGEIIETITSSTFYINRIPANYRGRISSFRDVSITMVAAVGNLLFGKLYDNFGSVSWIVILSVIVLCVIGFRKLEISDKNQYPNLYK